MTVGTLLFIMNEHRGEAGHQSTWSAVELRTTFKSSGSNIIVEKPSHVADTLLSQSGLEMDAARETHRIEHAPLDLIKAFRKNAGTLVVEYTGRIDKCEQFPNNRDLDTHWIRIIPKHNDMSWLPTNGH